MLRANEGTMSLASRRFGVRSSSRLVSVVRCRSRLGAETRRHLVARGLEAKADTLFSRRCPTGVDCRLAAGVLACFRGRQRGGRVR